MTKHPIDQLQSPEGREWRRKFLDLGFRPEELYFTRERDGEEKVLVHKAGLFAYARRKVPPLVALNVIQRQGIALTLEEECELVFGGECGA